jgi:multisubunit Na+/H+ antiporter MnhF subunit
MIPVLIFWLHITAGTYLFARRYYEETLGEAFLSIGFAAIIFTAGWTLSAFIVRIVFGRKGIDTVLDTDSLSLILLTILEIIFYRIWFSKNRSDRDKSPKDSTPSSGQAANA